MSDRRRSKLATLRARAIVFAALGDETRLTEGTGLTRQAVTKHLRVLEDAGVVRSVRLGRESLFELEPHPLDDARTYLDQVSRQWDDALARLKAHVEG